MLCRLSITGHMQTSAMLLGKSPGMWFLQTSKKGKINMDEFIYKYKKLGLVLHRCPICQSFTEHEYKQGEYIDIHCRNGCGRALTMNNGMSDEEHIIKAVDNWNEGKWEQ